jgi:hypothetical protein
LVIPTGKSAKPDRPALNVPATATTSPGYGARTQNRLATLKIAKRCHRNKNQTGCRQTATHNKATRRQSFNRLTVSAIDATLSSERHFGGLQGTPIAIAEDAGFSAHRRNYVSDTRSLTAFPAQIKKHTRPLEFEIVTLHHRVGRHRKNGHQRQPNSGIITRPNQNTGSQTHHLQARG